MLNCPELKGPARVCRSLPGKGGEGGMPEVDGLAASAATVSGAGSAIVLIIGAGAGG